MIELNPSAYDCGYHSGGLRWDSLFFINALYPNKDPIRYRYPRITSVKKNDCTYEEMRYKASRSRFCIFGCLYEVAIKELYEIAAQGCPILLGKEYADRVPLIEKIGVIVQWNTLTIKEDSFSDATATHLAIDTALGLNRESIRNETLNYCKKGTIQQESFDRKFWDNDWDVYMDNDHRIKNG
jgi:hypothetical protein